MKAIKVMTEFSVDLKFDGLSQIPDKIIQESFQSEIHAALKNTNTYWDNFNQNIQRSKVLMAQVERNVAGKGVSRQ